MDNYTNLSKTELELMGKWPPNNLPAKGLFIYTSRELGLNDPVMLIDTSEGTDDLDYLYLSEVKDMSNVVIDVTDSDEYQCVFLKDEFKPELYDVLAPEGIFAFVKDMYDEVKEFRLQRGISTPIKKTGNLLFFRKPLSVDKKSVISTPSYFRNPDSRESHLTWDYLRRYGNGEDFVETGTYLGDTVQLAIEYGYPRIWSIELNLDMWNNAGRVFSKHSGVVLFCGDSEEKLPELLKQIPKGRSATFWLDAHKSGNLSGGKSNGSPLLRELTAIKNSGMTTGTIFIDDVRLMGSPEWNGVAYADVEKILREINPDYQIIRLDGHVPGDILCATIVDRGEDN